jgi:hypothetical protein
MYPNLLYQLANHLNLIQNTNNTNIFQSQIQALRTLAPQSNSMSPDSLNQSVSDIAQQVLSASTGLNSNSQSSISSIWTPLYSNDLTNQTGGLTSMDTSQITNLATNIATSMHSSVASSLVSTTTSLMSSGCLGSPLTSMLGQVSQSWSQFSGIVGNVAGSVLNTVGSLLSPVETVVSQVVEGILNGADSITGGITQGLFAMVSDDINNVLGAISGIVSSAGSAINSVTSAMSSICGSSSSNLNMNSIGASAGSSVQLPGSIQQVMQVQSQAANDIQQNIAPYLSPLNGIGFDNLQSLTNTLGVQGLTSAVQNNTLVNMSNVFPGLDLQSITQNLQQIPSSKLETIVNYGIPNLKQIDQTVGIANVSTTNINQIPSQILQSILHVSTANAINPPDVSSHINSLSQAFSSVSPSIDPTGQLANLTTTLSSLLT